MNNPFIEELLEKMQVP
jgi:hypothetical protein